MTDIILVGRCDRRRRGKIVSDVDLSRLRLGAGHRSASGIQTRGPLTFLG